MPAERLSWRMTLDKTMRKGKGEIHFSEPGYKDPKWRTAFIEVVNKNQVLVKWFGKVRVVRLLR